MPSLQISAQKSETVELPPDQVQPTSMDHEELQPSPFIKLPSSHASVPTLKPSPQIGVHIDAGLLPVEVHIKFCSTFQVESHPSPLIEFPSSHSSGAFMYPSPQIGAQISMVVVDPPIQLYPISI
jgi:hypothetical protein